jgi:hypothetical protein
LVHGRRLLRPLLILLPGLLAWVAPCGAVEDGVLRVRVVGDEIRVEGQRSDAPVHLLELPPWQPALTVESTGVVARVQDGPGFRLAFPRFAGERDRLYSSFVLAAEGPGGTFQAVGTNRYVEGAASVSRHREPFPMARSIKGLQVEIVEDALALGIQHGSFNVNLTGLVDLKGASNSFPWPVDGRPVHFRRGAVEALDRQVKRLSDAGVTVYLILLTYASGDPALNRVMLHPAYDPAAPNRLGAFNTSTPEGVRHFRACLEFLADRYHRPGAPHGRAAGYILGNEVNSHWFWSNRGRVGMREFTEDHLRAARLAHTALRTVSSSARLYLSLEHHWNIRYPGGNNLQAFPGRAFLDHFARRAREQGDFDWHVAFHPYPENLFEPRSWRDKSATTNVLTTPRITFKNIELLPRYLRQPEFLFEGQPRRVILSEQGFHTPDGPEGELRQAAGYAYAWQKISAAKGIDSFILHRHVDHPDEGGLHLGLWRRAGGNGAPSEKKRIYEVFRQADTPGWEKAFEFALPVIGIPAWDALP